MVYKHKVTYLLFYLSISPSHDLYHYFSNVSNIHYSRFSRTRRTLYSSHAARHCNFPFDLHLVASLNTNYQFKHLRIFVIFFSIIDSILYRPSWPSLGIHPTNTNHCYSRIVSVRSTVTREPSSISKILLPSRPREL